MLNFIDRRLNPRDKSIGNRQRFLRRARRQIKEAVDKAANERDITDVAKGGKISIPSNGIAEPTFRQDPTGGDRERVFPGNREFVPGDQIKKPPKGGGEGGGKEGSDDGEGADDFVFSLSRSEFLDLLFEDLELPDWTIVAGDYFAANRVSRTPRPPNRDGRAIAMPAPRPTST